MSNIRKFVREEQLFGQKGREMDTLWITKEFCVKYL